ncbi:MAG: glutaredoxin family protein, partial [Ramlibacter sp.]
ARSLLSAGFLGVLAVARMGPVDANAQQIFRIVGPDGRVTFSDQAPLENSKAAAAKTVSLPAAGGSDNSTLPFELRQAANRYPVTLYTAPGCGPCGPGRAALIGRGIPFSEKTVTTNEDIEALKRMTGTPTLPLVTIGGQQLKGFSESEWTTFLDAAGYPKTSQLPPGFNLPAPAPMVAAQEPSRPAATPARPAPAQETPSASAPPPPAADNPTGIKF